MKTLNLIILALLLTTPAWAVEKTYVPSPDITAEMSFTDAGSGVRDMSFKPGPDIPWTEPEPYAVTKSLTLPGTEDGEYCIWAKVSDKVGNWSQPAEACVTLDTTAPSGGFKVLGIDVNVSVNVGVMP